MAGSAAERPRSPDADDSPSGWTAVLGRLWRRVVVFVAHWRLRLGVAWSMVSHAVGRAWRHYLRGAWRGDASAPRGTRHRPLLPSVPDLRPLPEPRDASGFRSDETDRSSTETVPSSTADRRGLPAGECILDVERGPDRLTISNPAVEEAYLSSTVWVDVEE